MLESATDLKTNEIANLRRVTAGLALEECDPQYVLSIIFGSYGTKSVQMYDK